MDSSSANVKFRSQLFNIPEWTVLILQKQHDDSLHSVFTTSSISPNSITDITSRNPSRSRGRLSSIPSSIEFIKEANGIWNHSLAQTFDRPVEQIRFTADTTDYLWYHRENLTIPITTQEVIDIEIRPPTDILYIYINGMLAHKQEIAVINVNMDQKGQKNSMDSSTGKNATELNFIVSIPAYNFPKSSFNLSILSVTMGLVNYGAYYEKAQKGLHGSIMINNYDITKGTWFHQIGLQGEYMKVTCLWIHTKYYNSAHISKYPWKSINDNFIYKPLIWYKVKFSGLEIQKLLKPILSNENSFFSFALHLGTMGKGQAWISNFSKTHSVGRYWDVRSDYSECPSCSWSGAFYPEKCPVGCGKPSQEYYHLPSDWIVSPDGSISNLEIVLLEERGGDPTGIQIVILN